MKGARVLVVDDEADIARLLVFRLQDAGFDAEAVGTATAALARAAACPPAVVLLDVMLPDLSGFEVCRRLRRDPKLAAVSIMMVTARAEMVDCSVAFEVGADDYIVKPFDVLDLVERVRALGRLRRDRGAARRAAR
jgi:two-component system phosphate regulon response regulator PhoB